MTGYRRVERFDPAVVEAMTRIGTPPTACDDRGPRIGGEGAPRCVKPDGHGGAHQSDDSWGGHPLNASPLPFPARTTDPDTSQKAAALPRVTLREQVRCALTVHPEGLTDWEICDYLGLSHALKPSVGKRRQEVGAVFTGQHRRSIFGQPCRVWRLP